MPRKTKSLRETKPAYGARRASARTGMRAIPAVTPIGSDEPVSKTLPAAVRRIARELRPRKIVLFGSYAYGNPNPDSDVDLLVVMRTKKKSAERSWAVSRLLIPRPFPTDILVKTPGEINHALRIKDHYPRNCIARQSDV